MPVVRLEVLHALLAEPGRRLLDDATAAYDESPEPDPLAVGSRLRREHRGTDPDVVAAAVGQAHLRRKAAGKLGPDAAVMYLLPEALEQATATEVAEQRARRLAAHAAVGRPDAATLVDLGCGVGSDLAAAARAGLAVTGVERDPVRAAMARANLAALGLPGEVVEADAEQVDLTGFAMVFADPARRDARGRVFDPKAYSPPWAYVERVLAGHDACVKISPAIPHRLVPPGVEAEWVSLRGEVKEAALWSRGLAGASRRATVLPAGATLALGDEPAGRVRAPVGPVGAYLYEPDGAVIRAGLVADLAPRLQARLLDPHIAYLTGDRRVPTPFARCFAVLEQLPFREKALRAALRDRHVGALTVKKRGVDVRPEALRRRLALRGHRPATLVLTRVEGSAVALLVEPV